METLQVRGKLQNLQPQFMYSLLSKLKPTSKLPFPSSLSNLKPFCTNPATTTATAAAAAATTTTPSLITTEKTVSKRVSTRSRSKVADAALLKQNWLQSLSCPLHNNVTEGFNGGKGADLTQNNEDWVIGIDPDSSGALALLRFDESGCSAQVFDAPQLNVVVGRRVRKRLNAKSIVQLLRSLDAPIGTTAYIEQSIPFPKDGKLGWWNGGFNYGIWIGILVASGFSVIPIPSLTWKNEFELSGSSSTKDDSRRLASTLFPSLSSSLTRKRDHGRAEALLIAAYAKGLGLKSASSSVVEASDLNGSPFLSPDPA